MLNANPTLAQTAVNIVDEIGIPPAGAARIVYADSKAGLAQAVGAELARIGVLAELVAADAIDDAGLAAELATLRPDEGQVILLAPRHAPVLFQVVGRPDQGIRVPMRHRFCDWLMPLDGLVRTRCVDRREHASFRTQLLAALYGASEIRITAGRGTDIALYPRHWLEGDGEVFTAVLEGTANGRIVIDGSIYSGPPQPPITLEIRDGRVVNLGDLDQSDEQQRMLFADLSTDSRAAFLAELGLGTNLGASRTGTNMEAEQSRSTVHLDFGNNQEWGGRNVSAFHGGGVLLDPTICVDGRAICRTGAYGFPNRA